MDDDQNGYIDDIHGWNFNANNNTPVDGHNHGTHVSCILGGEGNNGVGIWCGLIQTRPRGVMDSAGQIFSFGLPIIAAFLSRGKLRRKRR